MNFDFLDDLLEMAEKAAPVINALTGTPYAGAAVKAAEAIVHLIDGVKETAAVDSPEKMAQLEESRDALEARVNAHADRTIGSLGDDNG
jgi:hypothetical protein